MLSKKKSDIVCTIIMVAMFLCAVTAPEWVEAIGKYLTEVLVYA